MVGMSFYAGIKYMKSNLIRWNRTNVFAYYSLSKRLFQCTGVLNFNPEKCFEGCLEGTVSKRHKVDRNFLDQNLIASNSQGPVLVLPSINQLFSSSTLSLSRSLIEFIFRRSYKIPYKASPTKNTYVDQIYTGNR